MGEQHKPKKWTGTRTAKPEPKPEPEVAADQEAEVDEDGSDVDATDAAYRLAGDHGIDISTITGTGVDGRVTKDDVEAVIDAG